MRPDALSLERRAAIAASFVPARLRQKYANINNSISSAAAETDAYAALLWCDIAQFTSLSDRLVRTGPRGVERLSAILAEHFEPLLALVVAHGGEPLIFVGDALLVAWSCQEEDLGSAVLQAARCAEAIRSDHAVLDDRGDFLTLHLHVAVGSCRLVELGGVGRQRLFVPIGSALNDLAIATRSRSPGNVVLSSQAYRAVEAGVVTVQALSQDAVRLIHVWKTAPSDPPIAPDSLQSSQPPPADSEALNLFIPAPIKARLDANLLEWIAELRWITVVFVKLPDFHPTPSALHQVVQTVQPIIVRYEGVLNQVIVDDKGASILVVFGVPPFSHPENPVRGTRAAREIQEALSAVALRSSVGVTTGRAFCGIVGSDIRRHYTVIGDIVNLAARLMSATEDEILCDQATVRSAHTLISFDPREPISIKGYDQVVNVYAPRRELSNTSQVRLPTIGRHKEFEKLAQGLAAALKGENALFTLVGEPGIGKTRLVEKLRGHAQAMGTWVVTAQAYYVERDAIYHVWKPVFTALLGLAGIESLEARRAAALTALGETRAEYAGLLNAVLPLDIPDSPTIMSFSGDQRVAATQAFLLDLIREAAIAEPRVILFEDAHCFDTASWELVTQMLEIPGLLVLLAMQPIPLNATVMKLSQSGAQTLRLGGLEKEDLRTLICTQLGITEVPARLVDVVQQRGKGHPFFSISIVQALLDEGIIRLHEDHCELPTTVELESAYLPQNIQEGVTQQIDSLPPSLQLTLKVSSVVGMTFPTSIVQEIHPISDERPKVLEYLSLQSALGMIDPAQVSGHMGYTFSHGIIRDVAYNLMLFTQRCELHRQVAQCYETRNGNDPAYFIILAYHWEQAEEYTKAVDYLEREAIRVFSLGLAQQSVDLGLRAARLLGVTLPTDPATIGPLIGQNMGWIAEQMAGRSPHDLLNLPNLNHPQVERSLWLLLRIGPFAFQSRQIELFALMAVTALRLTLEHGNGAPTADVYSMYSAVHRGLTQDRRGAYAFSQLALDLDERNGRTMRSRVTFVHTWFHNHWMNSLQTSLPLALDGGEAGLVSGDVLFECFNISGYVVYLAALGYPLNGVKQVAQAHLLRNGRRVMNAAFTLILELQIAKALSGETQAPLSLTDAEFDEATDLASICKTELSNQIGCYFVARLKLHTFFRDWAGALDWAEKARNFLPAFEGQVAEIDLVQYYAIAALWQVRSAEAEQAKALIEIAHSYAALMSEWALMCAVNFAHKSALLNAEIARVEGDRAAALENYHQAIALADQAGFTQDAALAWECLAFYHKDCGDKEQAQGSIEAAIQHYAKWGAIAKVQDLKQVLANFNLATGGG